MPINKRYGVAERLSRRNEPADYSRPDSGVEYNPEWPHLSPFLRDRIWPSVRDIAAAIEHVASIAVPGLAATPIIYLDVVIPSRSDVPIMVTQLGRLGYEYRGNLRIEDREVFWTPETQPAHYLYVCPQDGIALRNHIALRDHLRAHPSDVVTYSSLKKQLAERYAHQIDRCVAGKTESSCQFLLNMTLCRSPGFDSSGQSEVMSSCQALPIAVNSSSHGLRHEEECCTVERIGTSRIVGTQKQRTWPRGRAHQGETGIDAIPTALPNLGTSLRSSAL